MIVELIALALAAVQPAQTRPPPCTARGAIRTDVVAIARAPERFLDRCVTVTGALAGIRMYSGREGLYLTSRFGPDGNPTAADLQHRIGIDKQEIRNLRMPHPMRATVTGRVDSCERRGERARARRTAQGEIPIVMLTGYCHYQGGPTIVVDAYEIGQQGYERMTGEAARRRYGNIALIPADWPHRAALEQLAAQFLAALRTGDRAALAALHDIRPGSTNESDRAQLFSLLDDPASPFVQLRRAAPSQSAIFVTSREGAAIPEDYVSGILCFCRTGDCATRWPIAFNDADNGPDRPYVCTKVEPRDGGPIRARLRTPTRGWLAEPSRTAFRAAGHGSTR
jgi:hypothetical protein